MRITVRNSYEPSAFSAPDVAVFFDVFRASTTLLTLAHVGASKIYSANDAETCATFREQGYQLISEVFAGGIDNSPTQVLSGDYARRDVIHKSTNLTAAVFHNRSCHRALIGSFGNAHHLSNYLRVSGARTIELVAASHFGRQTPAVEDVACAQMVHAMVTGGFAGVIPMIREVREKIAAKRVQIPRLPDHYLRDIELAIELDRFPYLLEAKTVTERLMEIVKL